MSILKELEPTELLRVYDLVAAAGVDVSAWEAYAGGKARAASNPKFCNEWSFVQPGKVVVCNLWYIDIRDENGIGTHVLGPREFAPDRSEKPKRAAWMRRARKLDDAIRMAYIDGLPVRVIVCNDNPRNRKDPDARASKVNKRKLDTEPWAVTVYDFETDQWKLTRGVNPPDFGQSFEDAELRAVEGEAMRRIVLHRRREAALRKEKLKQAKKKNDGRILCEVPGCGFEFARVYGEMGAGYAHVHHKIPLSEAPLGGMHVSLDDLAVVCANCHAMIHVGGQCRPLENLISKY